MSENIENPTVDNAQTTVKKNRRGVSNKTRAVNRLKFHESDAAQNSLFIGHLESVELLWSTNADSKQFSGLAMPRIVLNFASNHINDSEKRHITRTILPTESNVNTIPGGSEEWKVNNIFAWLKHILDVFYLKGRKLTEEEENLLTLPFEDYDDEGNYIPVEEEEILQGYRYIFENFVNMMNGVKEDGTFKPVYKTVDGKIIPIWIKLLRHKKNKNKWINVGANGDLDFDSFIGNGVIEILKKDKLPAILRVDLSRESITPKPVNQAPTIGGMPNMTGSVGVPVSPIASINDSSNSAYMDAADEMPF